MKRNQPQQAVLASSPSIKDIFDKISPTYDRLNHLLSLNIDKGWRRKAVAMIRRKPDESFKVLDLCAGTFDLSLEILRQFPNAKIIAMDFSQGMLDAGMGKIKRQMESGQITPVCGDCLNLPYEDNSVDLVTCAYGMRNLSNLKRGLTEAFRVLRPGGQLLVLDFFKPTNPSGALFHGTYARFVIPCIGKIVSGNDVAYQYLRDSIQGFVSVNDFNNLLSEIGFCRLETKDYLMSISSAINAFKDDL